MKKGFSGFNESRRPHHSPFHDSRPNYHVSKAITVHTAIRSGCHGQLPLNRSPWHVPAVVSDQQIILFRSSHNHQAPSAVTFLRPDFMTLAVLQQPIFLTSYQSGSHRQFPFTLSYLAAINPWLSVN